MSNLGNETTVSATDIWLTPPRLLSKLGHFDLDPCASLDRPWDTADNHYTIEDDGLAQSWEGRVWMNPPYGRGMENWMSKLTNHASSGKGTGLALIFARTETKTFFDHVWDKADAILFIKGRIKFCTPDGKESGTAGSPSVLIAYGKTEIDVLRNCGIEGKLVIL